jgi:hypothetical protein
LSFKRNQTLSTKRSIEHPKCSTRLCFPKSLRPNCHSRVQIKSGRARRKVSVVPKVRKYLRFCNQTRNAR